MRAQNKAMRNTRNFTICLAAMILIAALEYRIPQFHPLTALDRALTQMSSQTDLAHVLHEAQRAAEGR